MTGEQFSLNKTIRIYQREVQEPLSTDERLDLGARLAAAIAARDLELDRQKSVKDELKGILGTLDKSIGALASSLGRGTKLVEADVALKPMPDGLVQEFRVDNGEAVGEPRLPTADELQFMMPE